MRNFFKIERELRAEKLQPLQTGTAGRQEWPQAGGHPERNGQHPTAHQRGSVSPKGESGVQADERSFEPGGGGVSRLLWTSMTCRGGHRTGRGAQGWKLLSPHPWALGRLLKGCRAPPAAYTHPKDTEALCSHRAHTGLHVPIQREGKVETDGTRREENPRSCPFLSPSPFPDVTRPPRTT